MPNKENIAKWVEALESGDYVQAQGHLRTADDRYCCLGVACDISGLGEWGQARVFGGHQYNAGGYSSRTVLPNIVAEWLGVELDPILFETTAMHLNDEYGKYAKDVTDTGLAWVPAIL